MGNLKETDLYPPVRELLEKQGYEVKSEIGTSDVVAVRGDEPPVIVELKTGFSLSLFHQGINRQALSDWVYVAVPRKTGRPFQKALRANLALARRLGLGLITIRLSDGLVEVHVDPGPYAPRKSKTKQARLLREFSRRVGDPNTGGATRSGLVTSYRQDALKCVAALEELGASKGAVVAHHSGVSGATRLMAADHYGWFDRLSRGVYGLSPRGQTEPADWRNRIAQASISKS
jgi:hypothetical protein